MQKKVEMDKIVIDKILHICINVLCDDGKERGILLRDFVNVKKSELSLNKDDKCNTITLHIDCDAYGIGVL